MTSFRALPVFLAVFAVLGALDFVLTAYLLRSGDLGLREGNPLAAWVLSRHGWGGLAWYKVGSMGLVVGLSLVIGRSRPEVGRGVLAFACVAVTLVVVYSVLLLSWQRRAGHRGDTPEMAESRAVARDLESQMSRAMDYQAAVHKASTDLRNGHITLAEAVTRIGDKEQARDPAWQRMLRIQFPPLVDQEPLLAASLVQNTLARADLADKEELGERLTREFRDLFRLELPERHQARIAGPSREPIQS